MAPPVKASRRAAAMAVSSVALCMLSASAHALPSSLYVFGDSLSDTGNLYAWTGQANPVTGGLAIPVSPPYAQGTFTNGPVYADRLWDQLGLPGELAPAALPGGTNFAVGGARSRYHSFDVNANGLPPLVWPANFASFSLTGQFGRYRDGLAGGAADASALYLVWAGANDLQDVLRLAQVSGPDAAGARLVEAVGDVAGVIGGLVGLGARQLMVPTVPDIGAMPVVAAFGAQAQEAARQYSIAFNQAIDQALRSFAGSPSSRCCASTPSACSTRWCGVLQRMASATSKPPACRVCTSHRHPVRRRRRSVRTPMSTCSGTWCIRPRLPM